MYKDIFLQIFDFEQIVGYVSNFFGTDPFLVLVK
jgi:hypothetical protein